MLGDFEVTLGYLNHQNPRARLGALKMLAEYWNPPPDFPVRCERMVAGDNNADVRCLALSSLIRYYYGSRDARFSSWLAGIVRSESEPEMLRRIAYCTLWCVMAPELGESGIAAQPMPTTMRFPEEVSWEFVENALRRKNATTEER
jgi:hypothetical protein